MRVVFLHVKYVTIARPFFYEYEKDNVPPWLFRVSFSLFLPSPIETIEILLKGMLSNLTLLSLMLRPDEVRHVHTPATLISTSCRVPDVFDKSLFARQSSLEKAPFTPLVGFVDEQSKMMSNTGIVLALLIVFDVLCALLFVLHVKSCCTRDERSEINAPLVSPL